MKSNEHVVAQSFDMPYGFNEAYTEMHAETASDTILRLSRAAIDFAAIERVPRYNEDSRENDAEHSFMLSLVSIELAHQYYPDLDKGLIAQFCTVHDLVELETGDTPTFLISEEELAAKEEAEQEALQRTCLRLAPGIGKLLIQYESQATSEARFVRFVDKLLPLAVDIQGAGSKIMHEDYDVHTKDQLAEAEASLAHRCHERFPQPEQNFIHAVRAILSDKLIDSFDDSCTNYEKWPRGI